MPINKRGRQLPLNFMNKKEKIKMLEAYSLNATVGANSSVPFGNVTLRKGCTATLSGAGTIELNKCGIYMVDVDASLTTATTIQLYKDGVAQPQAQSNGTCPSFTTLVQVPNNNSNCPCSSPTTIEVYNADDAQAVFDNINIIVTKIV